MIKVAVACYMLLITTFTAAQDTPPNPYESWGVCPFECCTYRQWTSDAEIPVHKERSERSLVLFRLQRDERVDALTGVVVTENPAAIKIDRPVRDGFIDGDDQPRLAFKPGDVVYMLTPLGEGSYLFWYQGKVYHSGINLAAMPGVDGKGMKLTWWKQVRNSSGETGWTTSDHFRNVDACG